MLYLIILLSAFGFTGCTISVTLTDTHGYANDIVDETNKADADLDAEANIPASLL